MALRVWADTGKIGVVWVGRERRFPAPADAGGVKVRPGAGRVRLEGLDVRVPGAGGQGSLLAAQEAELR